MKSAYDECLVATTNDIPRCVEKLNTCIVVNSCWTDDTIYFKDDSDPCISSCYEPCASLFGDSSDLCDCSKSNVCILGCPENCDTADYDFNISNVSDCQTACITMSTMTDVQCSVHCAKCFVVNDCYTNTTLGGATDTACQTECYDNCDSAHGSDSTYCDCSHNACISTCE
jgi:hypothetical protein